MHHTVGGKWGMLIRRMCEAGARTLPFMIVLLIPVLLSLPMLYAWARPEAAHDPISQAKAAYLNVPGVFWRVDVLFPGLDFLCVEAEQVVGRAGSHRRRAV